MTVNRLGLLALTLCLGISGCTSVVNASREAPIEDDRGTRTFGSKIDDSLIETKAGVNIADMRVGRRSAHGEAVMVLNVDEDASPAARGELTRVEGIRRVHLVEL